MRIEKKMNRKVLASLLAIPLLGLTSGFRNCASYASMNGILASIEAQQGREVAEERARNHLEMYETEVGDSPLYPLHMIFGGYGEIKGAENYLDNK